jgi:hypothetical protein
MAPPLSPRQGAAASQTNPKAARIELTVLNCCGSESAERPGGSAAGLFPFSAPWFPLYTPRGHRFNVRPAE